MSIAAKRRETEVFSMAFLDCICCGFGAVLLIFVLTVAQQKNQDSESLDQLQERVNQLSSKVKASQSDVAALEQMLAAAQTQLQSLKTKNSGEQVNLTNRQKELLLLLQETGALKDALDKLLGEKKALPTEDVQPVPIPNEARRQYLTGVRLDGKHVLFLVRDSGSMLGETLEDAMARLQDPDFKKKEAPKWQRVIKSLDWMVANLDPDARFQIMLFNEETVPLLTNRGDEWISRSDRQGVQEALLRLREVVPQGSANMERAFTTIRYMNTLPDSIVLVTDGLPTTSDSAPNPGDADDDARIRYFRYAQRQLPARIPVSTILFPWSGDPGAPALFWELAGSTHGALVGPSASWPDT
ncbi:MAG TPA: hypothetical protein VG936_08980 [Lacunisphaera sp.]|nr:hypothetical protein [Lacunisphaera sp.]